ncbi:glycerol-3-phosphate phosphatase-like [Diadema antillarum]|uniref:glycerol-3-phosphate phosphatase-like n=2 Tax=Diadema antillarum TaxID=105358 RepID=UPI003A8BDB34
MATCRKLTKQLVKEFLDSIDTILLDCDGVLWHSATPIPGAVDTINKLRSMGKQPLFVTNNSTKSRTQYLEKFNKMGFVVSKDEIFGTAYIAALYLKYKMNFSGKVYLMGSKGMEEEMKLHGIAYTGTGPDHSPDNVLEHTGEVTLDPEVKGVVLGFDHHFSYMKIMRAASYLNRPGSFFIATNEDPQFPVKGSDVVVPGTGSLVVPVETASKRRATVMGKPQRFMFECIQEKFKVDPARTVMVGDRLSTDILLGKNCSLQTLAVLTGITNEEEILRCQGSESPEERRMVPDFYIESIGHLGKLIE